MSPLRLTHTTALILQALASGSRHGFQIMEVTGLPSGTVYPVLRRLEREGAVASEWEDEEVAKEAGCSYDWRDTGDPATTMAGRSLDKVNRTNAVLVFDSLPDWHAPKKINIARLDGSSHTVDAAECFKDLLLPVRAVDEA